MSLSPVVSAVLQSHPIFGELGAARLKQLASYARTRQVRSGTTLFAKGDPGTALFAIRAGTIKITVPLSDGREAMFNLLHAGEIFGEIALLDGRPRTADAIAVTDCELVVIERRDFLDFVKAEPSVALKLIELLCDRLRWASEHFEEVVFLALPARLARILLRLSEQKGGADALTLNVTQQELSQMLGSTRESVNKLLGEWSRDDVVAVERGKVLLRDVPALAAIAQTRQS